VSNYNAEADCFKIGNGANEFDLDFGLEDILYNTRLPIDGMPVMGIISQDVVQILVRHLAMENTVAENLLKVELKPSLKGGVNPHKLLKHFERPDVGILTKAFIFYNF
jgi:hypothetical protein